MYSADMSLSITLSRQELEHQEEQMHFNNSNNTQADSVSL